MALTYNNPLIDNITGSPTLDNLKSGSDKINNALEDIFNQALVKDGNLSGLASPSTAFNNIKQGGTESYSGVLQLTALASALAGTDENTAMPPDMVKAAYKQWGLSGSSSATSETDLDSYQIGSVGVVTPSSGLVNAPPGLTPRLTVTTLGVESGSYVEQTASDQFNSRAIRFKLTGGWSGWIRIDPQAFGLGAEFPPVASDANDINRPGFYRMIGGATGNVVGGSASVIEWQYDSNSRSQLQMRAGQTSVVRAHIVNFTGGGQQADAELYHTRNILGTVSQSSGVPTGAIIERGSNSNGEYVKFADGTLLMTRRVNLDLTSTSIQDFDYPISVITGGDTPVRNWSTSGISAARTEFRKTTGLLFTSITDRWSLQIGAINGATGTIPTDLSVQARWY